MSSSGNASSPRGRRRRPGRWAAGLLAVAAILAGPPWAASQDAGQPVVSKVEVRVDGRPAEAGLLGLIPLHAGDPYSPKLVDQAVKQVFRTGLFADVQVLKGGEDRVELVFVLTRNLFINAVLFRGTRASPARLREGLVSLRPGTVLQEEKIPEAVREVTEGLRKEGYFGASVACEVRRKAGDSTADLVYRAVGSKHYRIGSLEFEWKADIPGAALFKKMKSKVGAVYVPRLLEADLEALAARLGKEGYRRAEIRLAGEDFDEPSRLVGLRVEILPSERIRIAVNGAKVPTRLLEPTPIKYLL